jgi:NAD(P)H-flavin reductase
MFPIKKITATITAVSDLSLTARAVTITLSEPMAFSAGSFINVFIPIRGVQERRAFSISSSETITDQITISIRLNPKGTVSPIFWQPDIVGTKIEVMGPLGLNTASRMSGNKVFLFGFGVGAGVVKSLADHFTQTPEVTALTIITGNRDATDILHQDYFDSLANDPNITVTYVVSQSLPGSTYKVGYIQDHIDTLDFSNSLVYVCGQEIACQTIVEKIKSKRPKHCQIFIEGFH